MTLARDISAFDEWAISRATERSNLMYKKGDKVMISSASHGWGDCGVCEGDVATIIDVHLSDEDDDVERVLLNVAGKHDGWVCKLRDIVPCDDRVIQRTQATQWHNRMVEHFGKQLTDARNDEESSVRKVKDLERKVERYVPADADVFDKIKESIDAIKFDGTHMHIRTKRCYVPYNIEGHGSVKVDMGMFDVDVNFEHNGAILIRQCDNAKMPGGYVHPHVTGNGSPCWGTYHAQIITFQKTLDVCGMITWIMDFLTSCDRDGWYTSVLMWLTPDDKARYGINDDFCMQCEYGYENCECDRCSNCDSMGGNCDCNYCDGCDSYDDDCECARCPDSYDRLTDGEFPDVTCGTCSYLCRNAEDGEWQCHYDGRDNVTHSTAIDNYTPPSGTPRYQTIDEEGELHESEAEQHRQNTARANNSDTPTYTVGVDSVTGTAGTSS